MTTRRTLLALPLLIAARPLVAAGPSWHRDVSEVRVAGVDAAATASRLGVPVRVVASGVVEALNAGHVEAALLDRETARHATRLMGPRLVAESAGARVLVIRQALPSDLRAALRQALSA